METFIMGVIGPMQIVLIILVLLLLFGGAKIPMLMKNLGKGISEFKKATKGEEDTTEDKKDDTSAQK
ncbi:MAG: twin-arginine translocase TatA/TatE family subunit [Flavobacteriales bacterium]|nr:twin-arginine translocase TatA/TatE family subunit [Flavobacteriales bacterium]